MSDVTGSIPGVGVPTIEHSPDLCLPRRLPDDVFVIDAVTHAYNLDPSNVRNKYGTELAGLITAIHQTWGAPETVLPPEIFAGDTPIDVVAATMFGESQTSMAVHHVLRLDSWFHDGLCGLTKTQEALSRWPDRFIGYVGVDPLAGPDVYLDDLRRQVELMPSAVGVKLYPHAVDPYRRWRADDPEIMHLFELAQELGLRSVAIHKAVPNGGVPLDPYRVDDIDLAADAFPDLAFEIVHAGMTFVEETAWAISRFANVYANLEVTTALLWKAPGWFEEILGHLLFWGGPEKILWSTGAILVHPQPLLERFWGLQLSDRVREKYGLEQLSDDAKRLILGGNYARMIGLDTEQARARMAADEFAERRRGDSLPEPFSTWKAMAGAQR